MRIKTKSGLVLFVRGRAPRKKGDRFEATTEPEPRPVRAQPGCELVDLPGGGRAFSCRRGSRARAPLPEVRAYRFDPDIHQVVEEPR